MFVPSSSVSLGTDWLVTASIVEENIWIGSIRNVIVSLPLFSCSCMSFGRLLSFTAQHFRLIAVFPLRMFVVSDVGSRKSREMFLCTPNPPASIEAFIFVIEKESCLATSSKTMATTSSVPTKVFVRMYCKTYMKTKHKHNRWVSDLTTGIWWPLSI